MPPPSLREAPARSAAPRVAAGDADPNSPLWQEGTFRTDPWRRVADDVPLPEAPVILPKARWLKERDALGGRRTPVGLQLKAGEAIEDIVGDLARFSLIALDFPKFSDGRSFSVARLLREKHGFAGELRATGNVLADPIPLMRRVGFDAFEVTNAPTRAALVQGRIREVTLHYQPVGGARLPQGTRPWLRQSRP
jgi:uncharacterized protein (DUF934 family)